MKLPGIAIEYDPPPEAPGPAWRADIASSIATIEREGTDADREFAAREIARVLAITALKIAQRRLVNELDRRVLRLEDMTDAEIQEMVDAEIPEGMRYNLSEDPEILGGRPVFRGTRVPVEVLFDNLADGLTIDEIVASYPSLNRDDLVACLRAAGAALASNPLGHDTVDAASPKPSRP